MPASDRVVDDGAVVRVVRARFRYLARTPHAVEIITQVPVLSGGVKVTFPLRTCPRRSTLVLRSSTTGTAVVELPLCTRHAWTAISVWLFTPRPAALYGAGTGPLYACPFATSRDR